jgi:hypothetical protein
VTSAKSLPAAALLCVNRIISYIPFFCLCSDP